MAGVLAAGLALAVGELFSGVFNSVRSLVVSVAEAVVDWTPGAVARVSIDLFGTYQKTMLVWGIVIITLAIGAALGRAALKNRAIAFGVFATFGLAGGFAAARVPGNSAALSWLAALTAAAIGLGSLLLMLSRLDERSPAPDDIAADIAADAPAAQSVLEHSDRRRFISIAGLTSLGALGSWLGGSVLRRRFNVNAAREDAAIAIASRSEAVAATATPPPPPPTTAAVPAASTLTQLDGVVDGISPLIVPNDEFYRIDTALTRTSLTGRTRKHRSRCPVFPIPLEANWLATQSGLACRSPNFSPKRACNPAQPNSSAAPLMGGAAVSPPRSSTTRTAWRWLPSP